jgi:type IV pilus assembly protein PilA
MIASKLAARRRGSEEGFTLIELMVVVLIIAILIAIAIPTFLGARQRAQNRAAQSSLRNGLTAAKTIFTDQEDYTCAVSSASPCTSTATNPMPISAVEPSLTFLDGASAPSTGPNVLSLTATQTNVTIAGLSKSGTCYFIYDDVTGPGTRYNKTTSGACQASSAPANPGTWPTAFP